MGKKFKKNLTVQPKQKDLRVFRFNLEPQREKLLLALSNAKKLFFDRSKGL